MRKQGSSISASSTGSALPSPHLMDRVADLARASLSENTRKAYATQIAGWIAWCDGQGIEPFPASPEAVAAWIADRAGSGTVGGRRARLGAVGASASSIRLGIAALNAAHTAKGLAFDGRHPLIRQVLRGDRRTRVELDRQAAPLRGGFTLDLISWLAAAGDIAMLRDAAMLATGYAFALRRSELVGLDLEALGAGAAAGDGALRRDAEFLTVELARSKTMEGTGSQSVVTARDDHRDAVAIIERWIAEAGIETGTPIFRRIRRGGHVTGGRLHSLTVAAIVKARVAEFLVRAKGVDAEVARREAETYSGHSMRHGFATTAAEQGAGTTEIAAITRHRSDAMLARYVRQADKKLLRPGRRAGVGLRSDNRGGVQ